MNVVCLLGVLVLFATSSVDARHKTYYRDALENAIERYVEEKLEDYQDDDDDDITIELMSKDVPMCRGAGLHCKACLDCYPGGACVISDDKEPKCLCNYGWTGPNAKYIKNTKDPRWGTNRIRADSCSKECHYTHHVRNKTCTSTVENDTMKHEKISQSEDLNKLSDQSGHSVSSQDNPACVGAGLHCKSCLACHPGGWCVDPQDKSPKCLCNYGWTGPNAQYIKDTKDPRWGTNRIRADNCLKDCHYTHHVRNKTCAATGPEPTTKPTTTPKPTTPSCHEKCGKYQGACDHSNGRCKCCRGWAGPNKNYSHVENTYYADYCDLECPYLGQNIENPKCEPGPKDDPPACNPKCNKTDGTCVANGRCLCCLGWTGPGAQYDDDKYDGKILADYCDVYCPYTLKKKNALCTIPDYINRRRDAGYNINVKD